MAFPLLLLLLLLPPLGFRNRQRQTLAKVPVPIVFMISRSSTRIVSDPFDAVEALSVSDSVTSTSFSLGTLEE